MVIVTDVFFLKHSYLLLGLLAKSNVVSVLISLISDMSSEDNM